MDVLMKAESICKTFPGVKALNNVDFELRKGEVHALLGENGAGKSTLMKILSGVYQKDSGTIFLNGKEVNITSTRMAQDMGISIIHQELNLCPHLTVAQNIFIGREFSKRGIINEKKQKEEAKKILDKLHVDIDPNEKINKLPVSKQQMVEIAKALSTKAQVIIMDEPSSALTEKEIEDLFSIIKELKNQGTGIVYISHRLEELEEIVDRVTVLRDGEYIKTLNFKDTNLEALIGLMVGRKLDEKFPKLVMERGEKILEVKGFNKGKRVKNIFFDLYKGEILGFAGLMGAGRTELARAIFGADKIDSGEIYLNGKKLNIKSPADAIANGLAYIPEDRKHEGLSLSMNVAFNITLSNIDSIASPAGIIERSKEKQISNKIVSDLKIKTPSLEQIVKNLSGGNQQKVVVGKWLTRNPKVFIFDEPTRGIDVGAKIEIYNILNQLKKSGIGVIMISSELPEILGICDRVLVMCEGEIKAELNCENTNQEEIMHYATLYTNSEREEANGEGKEQI